MLELVLPPGVRFAESRADVFGRLFPEEEAVVERAVAKRRGEFATGRHCARRALAELGISPGPIGVGPKGEPRWPAGIVGSITHCDGFRGCAVARADELQSLGVDAEPDMPLPRGLLGDVARAEEVDLLEAAGRAERGVSWDRLLFCMKEAVYKAWFPLAESWLGFDEATISIDRRRRRFRARLLVDGPLVGGARLQWFDGRWAAEGVFLLAAVIVCSVEPFQG